MINHPMSPESVRIVHERQVLEVARRRQIARLVGPHPPSAIRRLVGAALVRVGRAIADERSPVAPAVPIRPGVRVT